MFCTKCGYECSDGTVFCSNCGENLCIEETATQRICNEKPLSITEYFEKECSNNAAKRKCVLKRLLRVSSIIQLSLLLLGLLINIRLLVVPMLFVYFLIRILLGIALTVCAHLLAKKGFKKKSPGRLFASVPLAFTSACIGTSFAINIPAVNIVIVTIIVVIHIAMIILNNKDVKEFREYLLNKDNKS